VPKQLIKKLLDFFFSQKAKISVMNKDEINLRFNKSSTQIVSDIIVSNKKNTAIYVVSIFNTENILYDKSTKLLTISGQNLVANSVGSINYDIDDCNIFLEVSVNRMCLNIMKFKMLGRPVYSNRKFEVLADIVSASVVNIIGQSVN